MKTLAEKLGAVVRWGSPLVLGAGVAVFAIVLSVYLDIRARHHRAAPPAPKRALPAGVSKFQDGDVTCYRFAGSNFSLSCVRACPAPIAAAPATKPPVHRLPGSR